MTYNIGIYPVWQVGEEIVICLCKGKSVTAEMVHNHFLCYFFRAVDTDIFVFTEFKTVYRADDIIIIRCIKLGIVIILNAKENLDFILVFFGK